MIAYTLVTAFLIVAIILYVKVAKRFNIVDVPVSRSSHHTVTIRGGGIIFPLSAILSILAYRQESYPLLLALVLISVVSFIDDLGHLNPALRLSAQMLSIIIMFYAVDIYSLFPLWLVILLHVMVAGVVNIINFMDGINGITGIYSFVTLITLCYINYNMGGLVPHAFFIYPALACAVFLYFNLAAKTRCFAGDVGSIGMAFWLCYLLVLFTFKFELYKCVFLLSVYITDAGLTIIKRILLKENILQAHRKHLYQILVNNGGYKHINVALVYGILQVIINLFIITTSLQFGIYLLVIILPLVVLYGVMQSKFNVAVAKVS